MSGVSIEAECLDASIPAGAWPVGVQVKSVDRMFACAEPRPPQSAGWRSDDAVLSATTFWEFPISTLYRKFPESRTLRSPQSPRRHAVDRGLGSGRELQELAGGALDLETLIVVRDRPRMRGS